MIKTPKPPSYPSFSFGTFLMQSSNERNPQPSLSRIALHTRQLFRVNTQRAATWFSKPSFSRFKRKSDPARSPSPSYSGSSLDDDTLPTYESLTIHSESNRSLRSTPPQTMSVEHSRWPTYNSLSTIPIIPGYCF